MIRKPEEIVTSEKHIRMLIAGFPGIGKTTLALSAPKPLHVDCDFGIDRIEVMHRKDFIQPSSYQELLDDLTVENVKDYETIVIDTGGKMLTFMSLWAIKKDAKNGKRDGSLSLQGYGTIGREFVRLMDHCFYELKKHLVIVFHAIEDKEGDNTKLRIKVEGQTKNNVWEPMDLGGFVEMQGNDRVIGFSNCERYFAKGTRGIHGIRKIPDCTNKSNDFLTLLFAEYNKLSQVEVDVQREQEVAYEDAIRAGHAIIDSVVDAESANKAVAEMAKISHALTSKKEINNEWKKHIKKTGLVYDRTTKNYAEEVNE